MTRSTALFQTLCSELSTIKSPEELKQWIDKSPPKESEIFDYKGAKEITNFKNHDGKKKVKGIWSEACSGFSNASGGVLLFGIDTGSNGRLPEKESLCEDVDDLENRLKLLTQDNCDPIVSNVETAVFKISGKKGLVLCHVPESNRKPHMAKHEKYAYYFRSDDGFFRCQHSLLRALFRDFNIPELKATFSEEFFHDTDLKMWWKFALENTGTVTLRDIVVSIEPIQNYVRGRPLSLEDWCTSIGDNWEPINRFEKSGEQKTLIALERFHPSEHSILFEGKFFIEHFSQSKKYPKVGIGFRVTIYSLDQRPIVFELFRPHSSIECTKKGSLFSQNGGEWKEADAS